MHDDPHAHRPALSSERGRYAEFVDELFRLKLIDREKRDVLRQGLGLAGTYSALGQKPAPILRNL